jgi:hypothetical protein
MVWRTWSVTERDGRIRHAALETLQATYWRERPNIETFGNRAHTDPDPQVRAAALEALVKDWPREPGVKELVHALAEFDPDPGAAKSPEHSSPTTGGDSAFVARPARWPIPG